MSRNIKCSGSTSATAIPSLVEKGGGEEKDLVKKFWAKLMQPTISTRIAYQELQVKSPMAAEA
jgi:hypothetical protein